MPHLMVSPVTNKGQVTLPKTIRAALGLKPGSNMVAFRVERDGTVEIVPVEIKEKKATPYTEQEWAKLEGAAAKRGKTFPSARTAKKFLQTI